MISIGDILIEEEINSTKFCCDLEKCKGACCTFPGDLGAPVLDEEIELIEGSYQAASKYLSEKSKDYIKKFGMIEGHKSRKTTVCIDRCDCVFVYYDGDIALCAIEKAYFNGETKFRKPISCHLFPIRVNHYGNNTYLYYQEFEECSAGRTKGEAENIPLIHSVKEALVRAYGEEWVNNYIAYLNSLKK